MAMEEPVEDEEKGQTETRVTFHGIENKRDK